MVARTNFEYFEILLVLLTLESTYFINHLLKLQGLALSIRGIE